MDAIIADLWGDRPPAPLAASPLLADPMSTAALPSPEMTQRLHRAAEAMQAEPRFASKVKAALNLVFEGGVEADPAHPAACRVRSGSHLYHIHPESGCTCPDAKYQGPWCKHRVAAEMVRRAGQREPTPTPVEPASKRATRPVPKQEQAIETNERKDAMPTLSDFSVKEVDLPDGIYHGLLVHIAVTPKPESWTLSTNPYAFRFTFLVYEDDNQLGDADGYIELIALKSANLSTPKG